MPRAAEVPKHCAERQHTVARRISPRSGPKFFKFFRSRSRKIFFVRNRARSRRNPCRLVIQSLATSRRGPQALCGASAYSGAADFAAIWTEIFQIFSQPVPQNFFRPKSREIAPKSLPIGDTEPCHEPQRSPSTVRSVSIQWRGGFRRDLDRNFSNFFAAAKCFSSEIARDRAEIPADW